MEEFAKTRTPTRMPALWNEHFDWATSRTYWVNEASGVRTFDPPPRAERRASLPQAQHVWRHWRAKRSRCAEGLPLVCSLRREAAAINARRAHVSASYATLRGLR